MTRQLTAPVDSLTTATMNEDDAIKSVHGKIEREKALINAANAMRQSTNNPAVLSRLDGQIREGRRNIEYLEGRARELQMRRVGTDMENLSMGSGSNGPPSPEQRRNPLPPPPKDDFADDDEYGPPPPGGYSQLSGGGVLMPPKAPYAPPGPGQPRQRPNYSKLGKFPEHLRDWHVLLLTVCRFDQVRHPASWATNPIDAVATRV